MLPFGLRLRVNIYGRIDNNMTTNSHSYYNVTPFYPVPKITHVLSIFSYFKWLTIDVSSIRSFISNEPRLCTEGDLSFPYR